MRTVTLPLLAILGLCGANTARAADLDYDYLRGADYDPIPAPVIDWSGVYVGGHGGYTSAALGSKGALQPLIYRDSHNTTGESDFSASTLLSPPSRRVGDMSFGAFAGYNVQFDDFVFGIEADYTHFGRMGVSNDGTQPQPDSAAGMYESSNLYGSTSHADQRLRQRACAGRLRPRQFPALRDRRPGDRPGTIADTSRYQNYGLQPTTYNANPDHGTPADVNNFGYASFNPDAPQRNGLHRGPRRSAKTKTSAAWREGPASNTRSRPTSCCGASTSTCCSRFQRPPGRAEHRPRRRRRQVLTGPRSTAGDRPC